MRDIAAGVRLAIESERAVGEIINLCEATTSSIRLWADWIVEAAGAQSELVEVPEDALPDDLRIIRSVRRSPQPQKLAGAAYEFTRARSDSFRECVVAITAVGSYPQWAMQFWHWTFPLWRPYFDQSVVSRSSL